MTSALLRLKQLLPSRPSRGGGPFDLLAPGLYAWGVTVAWPASQRVAPFEARLFAFIALVALVAGAGLAFLWAEAGRIFAIWVFLAACVASWAQVAPSLFLARLDQVQGLLGSVGWALFALGWARQETSAPPIDPPSDTPASPRQMLPRHVPLLVTMVSLAAVIPMLLSWWVRGLERALVAHAVAVAGAIGLFTCAAEFAEASTRTHSDPTPAAVRMVAAAPTLILLCILAALGAGYQLLR